MNLLKKLLSILIISAMLIPAGCASDTQTNIAATTLPVYELTTLLCNGTDLKVSRIINDDVSCLHNYTLQVSQMRLLEEADAVVISGAGLEDFLVDAPKEDSRVIDASIGILPICPESEHNHHGHHHETDPHIWLSVENGKQMARNIYDGLCALYPQHADLFSQNLNVVWGKFDDLSLYAQQQLSSIKTKEIITFHDGFSYMAQSYGLTILRSIEEESGSEASASELIALIQMVKQHQLPAIFVEKNGSSSAASVISTETGVAVYNLDMGLSGESYFDAMYYNIRQLKEALS